jgi:hypothetical protein
MADITYTTGRWRTRHNENHSECKGLTILENIVKNVKTSHEFNETEQLIDEMMENIHKIRQNRENNAGTVTEQKRIIGNEIRELRKKDTNFATGEPMFLTV